MTDTSIVKPLVWEDDDSDYTADGFGAGVGVAYGIYEANSENRKGWCVCEWPPSEYEPFATKEAAKAACQADYERHILSSIDLTAHDAKVRAEALEEVETIASRLWYSTHKWASRSLSRSPWCIIEKRQKRFLDDIRALKGEG